MAKNNIERVVKPLKTSLNLIRKDKKTDQEVEIDTLTVIDHDDEVVQVFRKQDYGPRYWFKATQYAANYGTKDRPLRVKELSDK